MTNHTIDIGNGQVVEINVQGEFVSVWCGPAKEDDGSTAAQCEGRIACLYLDTEIRQATAHVWRPGVEIESKLRNPR